METAEKIKNNRVNSDVSTSDQQISMSLSPINQNGKRLAKIDHNRSAKNSKKSKLDIPLVAGLSNSSSLDTIESILESTARELARAKHVLVITGAGISADSGLPTYRGIGGLYNDGQEAEEGLTIEEALSSYIMRTEPEVCWKYICQIESACRSAKPNIAHNALVALESKFEHFTLVTQNIDGLHRSAGTKNLIEIHGNIHRLFCTVCDHEKYVVDFSDMTIPPVCKRCRGLVRPRIVLFGETLPTNALTQLSEIMDKGVDAIITIGTSSTFPYIAQPVLRAAENNILTIEINPNETKVSRAVRYRLCERAAVVLPALLKHFS